MQSGHRGCAIRTVLRAHALITAGHGALPPFVWLAGCCADALSLLLSGKHVSSGTPRVTAGSSGMRRMISSVLVTVVILDLGEMIKAADKRWSTVSRWGRKARHQRFPRGPYEVRGCFWCLCFLGSSVYTIGITPRGFWGLCQLVLVSGACMEWWVAVRSPPD